MKFIDWNTLPFKRSENTEKMICPACKGKRTNTKDPALHINHDKGFGKCHYCEALTFRDRVEKTEKFELPKQDWQNYTRLSDKMVKWVENERKISQETLIELGITEEKYYQPSAKKELNNLVFNYFEGDVLVNKKYRTADKRFTQTQKCKSIFYNINSVVDKKECWIVEGEFDVLALTEIGIRNAISVPNGANDNDDYWKNSEKHLNKIEKFIIATDNDEKGIALREKAAQRLGRYRCEFVEWENKDANGDLIAGVLRKKVLERKRFPVSGTFKVEDLKDGIYNLYENGLPETIAPKCKSFGRLKDIFSVMRGHLVTGTGIPSHGKSNFTEWYVLNLIKDYNMKASFFSPEHSPMELHQTNFIQKAVGKPFWGDMNGVSKVTKEDIDRYVNWANEKIYISMPDDNTFPSWDWLLDTFKEQMFSYGIDIFVIDAFNKLDLPKGNKLDTINLVLSKLTMFAQMHNVIIFLIAHPTKMKKDENGIYDSPTLYDVSGSADFRNQTHDGFCVYRYFDVEDISGFSRIINLKTKMSFQGEIGAFEDFQYHLPTGRYFAKGEPIPMHDLTKEEIKYVETQDSYTQGFDEKAEEFELPF